MSIVTLMRWVGHFNRKYGNSTDRPDHSGRPRTRGARDPKSMIAMLGGIYGKSGNS